MIDPTGNNLNIQEDLRNQLKAILPQAFSDNNLDFEKLKQLLGDDFISPREERYGISWAGKTDAFRELQQTTTNTLSPDSTSLINHDSTSPSVGERIGLPKQPNPRGIFIEGENLEVLKVLQKSYYGKVKMIYIDPPYNTGNDSFVYPDDFSETKAEYQEKGNINLNRLNLWQKNSKDSGKYHSSWLSMMYPRLFMARNLLREDGIIFISIDENEMANLKLLTNELFGEECFAGEFIWNTRHSQQQGLISIYHEYILVYTKKTSKEFDNFMGGSGEIIAGAIKKISKANPESEFKFPAGVRCEAPDSTEFKESWGEAEKVFLREGQFFVRDGKTVYPMTLSAGWTQRTQMSKYFNNEEVIDTKGQKVKEFFFTSTGKLKVIKERSKITPNSILDNYGTVSNSTEKLEQLIGLKEIFSMPKPVELIKFLLSLGLVSDSNDIILDFFAGSGTTAQAVMELNAEDGGNRQFICVQMPEPTDEKSEAYKAGYQTIADITRARIEKVQEKLSLKNKVQYYKLQPSNFKIWQSNIDTEEELLAQLELYAQPHTTPETPEENLLTELMLKAGFMLTANVQTISTTDGIKLYDIENGTMTVALSALSEKVILTVCERKPKEFICLDNLFESDVQKSNWSLQLAEAGVNLQVI
jgi:adenine-specific DNA-methyltransferase